MPLWGSLGNSACGQDRQVLVDCDFLRRSWVSAVAGAGTLCFFVQLCAPRACAVLGGVLRGAADATAAEEGMAHPELLAGLLRRTRAEHHVLAAMGQAGVSEPLKELDMGSCNNPEPRSF